MLFLEVLNYLLVLLVAIEMKEPRKTYHWLSNDNFSTNDIGRKYLL